MIFEGFEYYIDIAIVLALTTLWLNLIRMIETDVINSVGAVFNFFGSYYAPVLFISFSLWIFGSPNSTFGPIFIRELTTFNFIYLISYMVAVTTTIALGSEDGKHDLWIAYSLAFAAYLVQLFIL